MKPSNTAQTTRLIGEAGTDVKVSQTCSWHSPYTLAGADPIVVARRLVLADEAGACTRGAAEAEMGGLGPVPRARLWVSIAVAEMQRGSSAGEKMFQFMTFPQWVHRASAPSSANIVADRPTQGQLSGWALQGSYSTMDLQFTKQSCMSLIGRTFPHREEVMLSPFTSRETETQRSAVIHPKPTGPWRSQDRESDAHTAHPGLFLTPVPPASSVFRGLRDDLLGPAVT